MKKRDIILDFTSLLDVTLIVIFFFVLFSHLDGQANKARTDEKIQELETAVQQAETREAKALELEEKLQKEIATVKESNKRQGSNINELISFIRSRYDFNILAACYPEGHPENPSYDDDIEHFRNASGTFAHEHHLQQSFDRIHIQCPFLVLRILDYLAIHHLHGFQS